MDTSENGSADRRLAEEITDVLMAAGLVRGEMAEEVRRKLAAGTAREADWMEWLAPDDAPDLQGDDDARG